MALELSVLLEMDADEILDRLESAAWRAEAVGEKIGGVGSALTAVVSAPIALLAAPALAAAHAHQQATASIRKTTGATGAALEGLVSIYQQVRTGTGAGMEQAAGAVGELARGLGLAGDDLKGAASAAVRLARMSGTSPESATRAVIDTMRAFGADGRNAEATLDLLAGASRGSSGGLQAFSAQLAGAAPQFRAAGLGLESAAAMLADLAARGVPTEVALGALSKGLLKLAKDGENMETALAQKIEAIRALGPGVAATQMAVDLFGKQGVAMADAIHAGALDLARLKTAGAGFPKAEPVMRLSEALGILRAKIEIALVPLGQSIATALVQIATPLGWLIEKVAAVVRAFASMPSWAQTMVLAIGAAVALVGPVVLFAGSAVTMLSGLALTGIKAIGIGKAVAMAVVAMATSVGAGFATAGTATANQPAASPVAVERGIERAGEAVAQSATSAEDAVSGVVDAAPRALAPAAKELETRARSPLAALSAGAAGLASRARPIPPMPELRAPVDTSGSLTRPSVHVSDVSTPDWQRAFDWQAQVDARFAAITPTFQSAPPMPFFNPKQGAPLGDQMREHAGLMQGWYSSMAGAGMLPMAPWMPGSWLDANRPEAWMARAAEMDHVIGSNQKRDQFFADQAAARNAREIEQWNRNQFALSVSPYGLKPQVLLAEDIFTAINMAFDQAIGSWRPLSEQAGSAPAMGGGAPAPAGPPPAGDEGSAPASGMGAPGAPGSPGLPAGSAASQVSWGTAGPTGMGFYGSITHPGTDPRSGMGFATPGAAPGRGATMSLNAAGRVPLKPPAPSTPASSPSGPAGPTTLKPSDPKDSESARLGAPGSDAERLRQRKENPNAVRGGR